MLFSLVIGAAALLISYCYVKLRYKRFNQYAHFPQLPTSFLFGHLKSVDSLIRGGKPDGHPGRLQSPSLVGFIHFLETSYDCDLF